MSEMATYVGIEPRTIIANAALSRGVRCTINSSGTYDVQDASAVGDMVTLGSIEAGKPGPAAAMAGGGKVPALCANVTIAVGDPAYTAANGLFTNVSTNATFVGHFTQPGSNAVLSEVELGV
jgi:hypothetical protein